MLAAGITLGVLLVLAGFFLASYRISSGIYLKTFCCRPQAGKKVALTFDDGVSPQTTPLVLDILKKHGAKATFFLVGERVDAHPALAGRIAEEGHSIGNHSYFHRNTFPLQSSGKIQAEISACDAAIARATGIVPGYFRPPFGVTNPMVGKAVRRKGKLAVGWSIRSFDTKGEPPEKVFSRIRKRLRGGDVILLHDDRPGADLLLERLLVYLQEQGYEAVTIETLMGNGSPGTGPKASGSDPGKAGRKRLWRQPMEADTASPDAGKVQEKAKKERMVVFLIRKMEMRFWHAGKPGCRKTFGNPFAKAGLLPLLLALLLPAAYAQETGADAKFEEFKGQVSEWSQRNKTIVCDFLQEKKVRGIREPERREGRFFYDNEGKIALLYAEPAGDKVVMDGDRFVVVNAGKRMEATSESNPMLGQMSGLLQGCMTGNLSGIGKGWNHRLEETGEVYRLELLPQGRQPKRPKSLTLVFSKSDMTLEELRMEEGEGFMTRYVFKDKQRNVAFDRSVFE